MSLNYTEKTSKELQDLQSRADTLEDGSSQTEAQDVFGDEADHDIQYKTLSWQVRIGILRGRQQRP